MSIIKTEDSINVLLGEKDVAVFTCLINNFPTLIMQEITEEMRQDEGFPYSYKGKSVTDLPHVRLTFKNKEEVDKLNKWLSELSEELKLEEEFYKEALLLSEESEDKAEENNDVK